MSIFLSFFSIPQLTSFFCTIFCIFCRAIYQIFHPPNIHSVSNPCNISLGHDFGEFLSFFGHNSTFARWGTVLYKPGQFQIGSPVRISLGQIYIGICLPGNNESTLAL